MSNKNFVPLNVSKNKAKIINGIVPGVKVIKKNEKIPSKETKLHKENLKSRYGNGIDVLKKDISQEPNFYNAFETKALDIYQRGIANWSKRIVGLDFFNNCSDEDDLERNKWRINLLNFYCDKNNEKKLFRIAERFLKERFGSDALTKYGIPDNLYYSNLPFNNYFRDFEDYVFLHSDDYLDALIKAPKIAIEKWQCDIDNNLFTLYSKKVLMNVDNQIILGEFSKKINKNGNYMRVDAGNSISFCVYYRGREDGKFLVERWDYEPHKMHLNKLNEQGEFMPNGYLKPNTKHSHVHRNSFRQRLIFGQNISCDIEPTPVNSNPQKREKRYKTFKEMQEEFYEQYNILNAKMDGYYLYNRTLKSSGLHCCPKYDSKLKEVTFVPPKFEKVARQEYDFSSDKFKGSKNISASLDGAVASKPAN